MQVLAGLFTSFFHFEDSLFHLEKLFILLLEQRRKISFFSLAQGGEITVYGLTETAWQVSSVGLHVQKYGHDYRLNTPEEDKTKNNMSKGIETISLKDPHAILGPGKRKDESEIVEEKEETPDSQPCKRKRLTEVLKAPKLSSKDRSIQPILQSKCIATCPNCFIYRIIHLPQLKILNNLNSNCL